MAAEDFKVGDRVRICPDGTPELDDVFGRVVEVGYAGVKVEWNDGNVSIYPERELDILEVVQAVA